MAGIRHTYQSPTANNPESEISSTRWNQDHTIDPDTITREQLEPDLRTEFDGLETRLAAAEGDIDQAESDIVDHEGRISTAEGEIDVLQAIAIDHESRIGALESSSHAAATLNNSAANYLTLVGQAFTTALINLANHVTGRLPFANFVAATGAAKLLGRQSGSAGDFEELTAGDNLEIVSTALRVKDAVTITGSSTLGTTATANAAAIILTILKTLGTVASAAALRIQAYSPSIELLDKDAVQNWYFGINDDDSDALYIGRGYGPNQGITPAIHVRKSDDAVQLAAELVLQQAISGIRTNTANGSDTKAISVAAGGAVNDATRGACITMTGNEFGSSLGGAIHLVAGDHADGAIRMYGRAGQKAFEVDQNGHTRVFDLGSAPIIAFNGITGRVDLGYGQLNFPSTQNPSSDANTFDDYEEGTWTPTIGGSTSETGQSYTNREGRYIKKGSEVWAACWVRLSTKGTITGTLRLKGLPFTLENGTLQYYNGSLDWVGINTAFVSLGIYGLQNTTQAHFTGLNAAGNDRGSSSLVTGDIDDDSGFIIALTYRSAN